MAKTLYSRIIKTSVLVKVFGFLLMIQSCGPGPEPPKVYEPNQEILDLFQYKEGSYWIYQNQTTMRFDTFTVNAYYANYREAISGNEVEYKDYRMNVVVHRSNIDGYNTYEYISSGEHTFKNFNYHQVFRGGWDKQGGFVEQRIYVCPFDIGDSISAAHNGWLRILDRSDSVFFQNQWVHSFSTTTQISNAVLYDETTFTSKWVSNMGMIEFIERGQTYKLVDYYVVR